MVDARLTDGPVALADLDTLGGFCHIAGLAPGDKVTYKGNIFVNTIFPEVGEVLTVHQVGAFESRSEMNNEQDFTVLYVVNGTVLDLPLDSRRFKRVTE